jgi:hypothetical protein
MANNENDQSSQKSRSASQGAWLTPTLWLVGVALQFAAPLLRDKVPLSDDLFITSILTPWWVFLQVLLLTGWLWLFRRKSAKWTERARIIFALVSALFFMLLEPNMLTLIIAHEVPLRLNPVGASLIWSTPLFFYVLPAALVIYSWLKRPSFLPLAKALGLGLVLIGVLNFGYILWLTHLWDLYLRPSGSGTVFSMAPSGFFG